MPQGNTPSVGEHTAVAGKLRLAGEAAGAALATAALTFPVAASAGFVLAVGIETGWNYGSVEASWLFIVFVPHVLAITLVGTPLSYALCGTTRLADPLPRSVVIRRTVIFAAPAGLLCPELVFLFIEHLRNLWEF